MKILVMRISSSFCLGCLYRTVGHITLTLKGEWSNSSSCVNSPCCWWLECGASPAYGRNGRCMNCGPGCILGAVAARGGLSSACGGEAEEPLGLLRLRGASGSEGGGCGGEREGGAAGGGDWVDIEPADAQLWSGDNDCEQRWKRGIDHMSCSNRISEKY